jgi:hypothetical protein
MRYFWILLLLLTIILILLGHSFTSNDLLEEFEGGRGVRGGGSRRHGGGVRGGGMRGGGVRGGGGSRRHGGGVRGGGMRGGGGSRRHGGGGSRRHGGGRRWFGQRWGYRYRAPQRFVRYNPWTWFGGRCKNGCTSIGGGGWGCQYPGSGPNDCWFADDCYGCGY